MAGTAVAPKPLIEGANEVASTRAPSASDNSSVVSPPVPSPNVLRWVWSQWWIVTAAWWACAILVVVCIKHEAHKSMLTALSNLLAGLMVAPFALHAGLGNLRKHFGSVFAISILAALERNLTNSSMYSIGAALKTALHGFNVPFTFFAAAFLGADPRGNNCLLKCQCRDNIGLLPALSLVTGGSFVAAAMKGGWHGGMDGVILQLASSVAYAVKFTVAKLLLGSGHGPAPGANPSSAPPSKIQVAFVANPMTGLMALAFLPFFEKSWELPALMSILGVAIGANGILFFELRLVELTSALTVAVLAAIHNVAIVLYFLLVDNEPFSKSQQAGFAVSTLGTILYAVVKSRQGKAHMDPVREVSVEDGETSLVAPVGEQLAQAQQVAPTR